ncbi:MAG TPA: hypothetical protein PK801_00170 [Aggregatilineales bacterium]|nr:hypothetical protein [Chloroflexota bacterium]HOA23446.1 hypothetical protein [Aggregatilineales bacterium]HPV08960.1 hypothetical protein [Aggregatilineales bacterium]HQA66706.1 hypothetical protein [Aggregatilineales bacterium]HQE20068.1 hypothetical protein [Aggregatilineales bacterium]
MIFQVTWQQVLNGTKTQTSRIVKAGEELVMADGPDGEPAPAVLHNGRIKWQVGRTYSVQPGRNEKAVGYIRLTGIERKRVQALSDDEALAEGAEPAAGEPPLEAFRRVWEDVHGKGAWEKNPEVWVLSFELVEEG